MNMQAARALLSLLGILVSFGAFAVPPTASATAPTTLTIAATSLTGTTAQLNGSANPNGAVTLGWFRYSDVDPGTCDSAFGTRAPVTGGSDLGDGNSPVAFSEAITGLSPGTTYYYCALAKNSVDSDFGSVLSFSAPLADRIFGDGFE